jgi:non-haem Fe2+, alpha-ketoglutarate-dependent halogenase
MPGHGLTRLNSEQELQYRDLGYCSPIRVLEEAEAADLRAVFLSYLEEYRARWEPLLPRDRRVFFQDTHLCLRWVSRLVSAPKVLDAVETFLGPNLMVWASQWFPKMPGDKAYVSWHQDGTYWGLHPSNNITSAWIALAETTPENGCMRVIPGTHKHQLLRQTETYSPDNVLSRGQAIEEVNEAQAVDVVLRPGEMSLHHPGIIHGSGPNQSQGPRIGISVIFITPDVVQNASEPNFVTLVRGKNEFQHFTVVDPPHVDEPCGTGKIHTEALRRQEGSILAKDRPRTAERRRDPSR